MRQVERKRGVREKGRGGDRGHRMKREREAEKKERGEAGSKPLLDYTFTLTKGTIREGSFTVSSPSL